MDRARLLEAWEKAFGSPPANNLSAGFIRRALAHEAQCRRSGGLSPETRRLLREIAARHETSASAPAILSAGAYLVREWNGRSYRVEVTDKGYRYEDQTYRSLSAIARRITGTQWSGPRFFGLTRRKQS